MGPSFRVLLLGLVCAVIAATAIKFVWPPVAHSTEAAGDFWRLPWVAGIEHKVGGNGYGENTHDGTSPHSPLDYFALDYNLSEGATEERLGSHGVRTASTYTGSETA